MFQNKFTTIVLLLKCFNHLGVSLQKLNNLGLLKKKRGHPQSHSKDGTSGAPHQAP